MPIVITRTGDGAPIAAPLSPEQKNAAWESIIRAWLRKHPEEFKALLAGEEGDGT